MAPVFVLGSASPARLAVLQAAGVNPLVHVSDVDEDAVAAELPAATPFPEIVTALASAKAHAVAAALDPAVAADCVVVGCDSMLLHEGRLLGKPHTPGSAAALWAELSGSSGELLTGHSVVRVRAGAYEREISECAHTTVHFAQVSAPDIADYVATGEPLHVAGGFTLDGLGGWFIEGIEGDPSSVIGISLPLLRRLLTQAGVNVTQLWGSTGRD